MVSIQQTALDILALVGGGVAIVGGAVAAAYFLFKLLSEKWLTAKFDERLAAYKHQQQKELEELRFKISGLLDRTTKLHQREFEVLPEAWARLVLAHAHVQSVVSGLQQYPDLDRMEPSQLSEFLDNSKLANWQKEELKTVADKTRYYTKAIDWQKGAAARETYRDFFLYFRQNAVFIRNEIKSKFSELADHAHESLVEYEMRQQHTDFNEWKAARKLSKESPALLKSLEELIQNRHRLNRLDPFAQDGLRHNAVDARRTHLGVAKRRSPDERSDYRDNSRSPRVSLR
jgi:hypothetical protein